jgi:hypothetical protein
MLLPVRLRPRPKVINVRNDLWETLLKQGIQR